jgi:hypothetical protein
MDNLTPVARNNRSSTRRNNNKRVSDYIVVSAAYDSGMGRKPFKNLNDKVMEKVKDGYVLQGGVSDMTGGTLIQALVKY